MRKETHTQPDRIVKRLKNNPLLSVAIVGASCEVALSSIGVNSPVLSA
jgi:hypothetical protein